MSGKEGRTPAELAREALRVWKADPVRMVRDLFQVEPDEWQKGALDAFASPDPAKKRIALLACAGPGKSAVEAWMGWNFELCYSDGVNFPNGYAISVTGDNLRDNLWKELALWRQRSPVLTRAFEQTAESIFSREYPETWWLRARSFSKSADADAQGRTLSGLHAKSILYLIDESGDIPPAVGRSAEQGLGNCEWGKIVQAGNPTSHAGLLHQAAQEQSHLWFLISITADPDDPKRTPRVSIEWAREQILLHGRDNPWVMSYILGKFPPTSLNALLGPDEVRAALGRHLRIDEYSWAQKRLGVDCARFGDDSWVLFPRQGKAAFKPVEMKNPRTEEVSGRIAMAKAKWGFELGTIDGTGGFAGGTVDSCRMGGIDLLEINASSKPDEVRYFNKRSETQFRAAAWVKSGGALPNLPHLIREACASTYYFDNGKLRVTEKAQVKALLGKSPDFWDAFCLTFAVVDMPGSGYDEAMAVVTGQQGTRNHAESDWDVFREL